MNNKSASRSRSIIIAAAIVLAGCASPQPTSAPASPSPVPTQAASTAVKAAVTQAPALVPTRVVTRSAEAQPPASQTAAPSPVGQHPLNSVDLSLVLNANGTANLDAPTLDTGAAARSWHGIWLQETDQGIVVRLNTTAEGVNLLAPVGFQVSPITDTWQVDAYIVGSASYSAPEVQSTFGSGQRHPLIAALNNLLTQVPYLNYTESPAGFRSLFG